MPDEDLITLIQQNDKAAKRQVFEQFYGKFLAIANRYSKNATQAEEVVNVAVTGCFDKLYENPQLRIENLEQFLEKEFILGCVNFIKSIRSEYLVASTVHANAPDTNYNLFDNNDVIDFERVETDAFIKALQKLVPSQRLIFNLHVVDGYGLQEAAAILEASAEAVKSNLEKARYNLQKNIKQQLLNK